MRLPLLPVAPRRKIFTTAGPLPFFVPFVVPWVSPHWFFSPASCRCPHRAQLWLARSDNGPGRAHVAPGGLVGIVLSRPKSEVRPERSCILSRRSSCREIRTARVVEVAHWQRACPESPTHRFLWVKGRDL